MISVWYKDNLSSLFWSFLSLHDKRPNFVCWWRPFHVKLWKKPSVELEKLFCQAVWFHYPFFLTLDPVSLKLPCLISLQLVIYYNPQNAFGKLYYSRVGGNSNQRGKQSSKELFYLQTWSLTHTLTCSKLPLSLLHCFSVCMIRKKHFLSSDWHQQLTFTIDVLHLWHLLCCQTLLYLLEISWWYSMSACLCLRKVEHKGPQTAQYQWLISGSTQSQNTMNIHRRCEVIKWNIQHIRDIQSVS